MTGGGMALRRLVGDPGIRGAGIMGALYVGIGLALFLADRIFWRAAAEEWLAPKEADS